MKKPNLFNLGSVNAYVILERLNRTGIYHACLTSLNLRRSEDELRFTFI